ncbi:MAG: efflux RND transporter periplasmic adaptor subunit [Bacteroidales bacterium]|nr:efflux RND transporter periplasmic adaptor subunit [Bacteroidales bacterium]
MNNKKVRIIIIASIGLLIVLLIVASKLGWIGKKTYTKVSVQKVEERNIVEYVTASGKIQPEKEIIIAPDASGEIVGLFVKEGDSVKAGDLLLKINPDVYLSNVEKVTASLNTSRANLANSKARLAQTEAQFLKAEADFNRNQKLFNQKVISQADFDMVNTTYQVAKAEVKAAKESVSAADFSVRNAEAALKEAQDNLTKTAVFAPIDGTISKLDKEMGERVAGASQFSGGTEVMRIANLSNMEAQVDVSENDIVRVKLGDTALIEVDAYLDRKFKGVVTRIANSSTSDLTSADQVTNFKVRIRILQFSYKDILEKNPHIVSPFRPGMSASVEIRTNYRYNVLSVPIQAVTTRTDTSSFHSKKSKAKPKDTEVGGQTTVVAKKDNPNEPSKEISDEYVFVLKEDKVVLRKVKAGIQDDQHFEIIEGLSKEDMVVVAPYRAISTTLKNGEMVEVVDKTRLFD